MVAEQMPKSQDGIEWAAQSAANGPPNGMRLLPMPEKREQLLLGLAQAGPGSQKCKQKLCGPMRAILLLVIFT